MCHCSLQGQLLSILGLLLLSSAMAHQSALLELVAAVGSAPVIAILAVCSECAHLALLWLCPSLLFSGLLELCWLLLVLALLTAHMADSCCFSLPCGCSSHLTVGCLSGNLADRKKNFVADY